jgi:hypothetical protein
MAAVFALVFVPALASIALMLATARGELGFGTAMAMISFVMLASGVFYGLLRLTRQWEETKN